VAMEKSSLSLRDKADAQLGTMGYGGGASSGERTHLASEAGGGKETRGMENRPMKK